MTSATSTGNKPTWTSIGGKQKPQRDPYKSGDWVRTAILGVLSLLVVVPIAWIALASFKSRTELAARPPTWLPHSLALGNFSEPLKSFSYATYLRNSVVVTIAATVLTLVINSMAAYALAKYNFRGKTALFLLILGTIMVPLQVILLPVYQMAASLGLVNNLLGLIIPPAATPTGVFLLRQYMLTIPDDLIEAARIDGCSEFRIFWSIVLPLCKPALAVVAIFSVIWRWNDFLWPLIIAQDESVQTLPVALARLNSQTDAPQNYIIAMSVMSMVPMIIVFLLFQRQIVQGIASTGLKG